MRTYIIRRLLLIIPTLMLVSIIVFLLVRFIPGSAVEQMAAERIGEADISIEEFEDIIRQELGLDQPIHMQYLRWLGAWPQNGWGWNTESSVSNLTVTQVETKDGEATTIRAEVFRFQCRGDKLSEISCG